ncbi:MAG: hypothetical protein CSA62_04465 [Planctomycetota bacterium]|nr:MAG: hypothetical protein CSA62_04465 [Planctomycetota bacterium]
METGLHSGLTRLLHRPKLLRSMLLLPLVGPAFLVARLQSIAFLARSARQGHDESEDSLRVCAATGLPIPALCHPRVFSTAC